VPGIGHILSLVLLYDIHPIDRFPRGQDCASSCRRVTCAKEAGGQRLGTSGHKIGNAHLTWAFSEAAMLCLRGHEPGHKDLARLEHKHDNGTARSILAHNLARAVSVMRTRQTACDLEQFLWTSGAERVSPAPNSTLTGCVCS
jgi:transposase